MKTFIPILRWLLLPILFYILGQFLEGAPYRVIVRGIPFILTSFVLSGLAAHYLCQRIRIPLVVLLVQALLLPVGFIFVVQKYYNGGVNSDYTIAVSLFALAMGVNGMIYLRSLFHWKKKKQPLQMSHYDVKLYTLCSNGTPDRLSYHNHGEESPPEAIILDGFSQNQCIDLDPYWAEILDEQIKEFQTDITVRETIIKFGETMQLVDHYRLQINVDYQH